LSGLLLVCDVWQAKSRTRTSPASALAMLPMMSGTCFELKGAAGGLPGPPWPVVQRWDEIVRKRTFEVFSSCADWSAVEPVAGALASSSDFTAVAVPRAGGA